MTSTDAQCRLELTRMERHRTYASNQAAIAALELTTAMAKALTARFGAEFADGVAGELRQRAETLAKDGGLEDHCTGSIVTEIANWHIWSVDPETVAPEKPALAN